MVGELPRRLLTCDVLPAVPPVFIFISGARTTKILSAVSWPTFYSITAISFIFISKSGDLAMPESKSNAIARSTPSSGVIPASFYKVYSYIILLSSPTMLLSS